MIWFITSVLVSSSKTTPNSLRIFNSSPLTCATPLTTKYFSSCAVYTSLRRSTVRFALMTSRSGIFTAGKRQNYAVGQRRNFSFCRGREMQPKPQEVVVSRIKVKLFVLIKAKFLAWRSRCCYELKKLNFKKCNGCFHLRNSYFVTKSVSSHLF